MSGYIYFISQRCFWLSIYISPLVFKFFMSPESHTKHCLLLFFWCSLPILTTQSAHVQGQMTVPHARCSCVVSSTLPCPGVSASEFQISYWGHHNTQKFILSWGHTMGSDCGWPAGHTVIFTWLSAKKIVSGSSGVPGSAWAGQRINSTCMIHRSPTEFLRNKLYPNPVIQS